MSSHYLVSHFDNAINGVVTASGSPPASTATGNYIIRVADDVSVKNPTNLADLLTKKYASILGTHGLFTQIVYDDMLDGSGVDAASSTGVLMGDRGTVGLYPTSTGIAPHVPLLQTAPASITWGGPGVGPPQSLLTYELFEFVDTDDKALPYVRQYREVTPDVDVTAQVSFNGGVSYISTTDKALITVPLGLRGTSVVLRFTRATNISARGRVLLGSWAVLF